MLLRRCLSLPMLLSPLSAGTQLAAPESALATPDGVLVSNIGTRPAPSLADGDGYIARLTPDGMVQDIRYLPFDGVLNAPKGMALVGRRLYVADIDRLVVADWGSGRGDGRLHAYHLEHGRTLRDLLTGLDGPADLAADPDSGRIWLPEMLANRLRTEVLELDR